MECLEFGEPYSSSSTHASGFLWGLQERINSEDSRNQGPGREAKEFVFRSNFQPRKTPIHRHGRQKASHRGRYHRFPGALLDGLGNEIVRSSFYG